MCQEVRRNATYCLASTMIHRLDTFRDTPAACFSSESLAFVCMAGNSGTMMNMEGAELSVGCARGKPRHCTAWTKPCDAHGAAFSERVPFVISARRCSGHRFSQIKGETTATVPRRSSTYKYLLLMLARLDFPQQIPLGLLTLGGVRLAHVLRRVLSLPKRYRCRAQYHEPSVLPSSVLWHDRQYQPRTLGRRQRTPT